MTCPFVSAWSRKEVCKLAQPPTITSEEQYQQERGKDDSKFFPVPGGVRQHRRRVRAWLQLLEQTLSR